MVLLLFNVVEFTRARLWSIIKYASLILIILEATAK